MRIAAELIATGRASHAWLGAQVNSDIATRGARIIDVVKQRPPQPETVTALLPRLHVENASAMRPVDALRARLATTSRVRRYQSACAGYGIPLDQHGRPPRRSSAPEPRMPRLGPDS